MKCIFLDFDGVLVNHRSWYVRNEGHATADPPCVAALNSITEATGASIVVSSTWRIGTPLVELRRILKSWGVTGDVIDKTPHLTRKSGSLYVSKPRGDEIKRYLEDYDVESFVILDDDNDMGSLTTQLVQTDFETGLTAELADLAIAKLQDVLIQT